LSFSSNSRAEYAQRFSHIRQPLQRSSSIFAEIASTITLPAASGSDALTAAPLAWATTSGISFGLWQHPA